MTGNEKRVKLNLAFQSIKILGEVGDLKICVCIKKMKITILDKNIILIQNTKKLTNLKTINIKTNRINNYAECKIFRGIVLFFFNSNC